MNIESFNQWRIKRTRNFERVTDEITDYSGPLQSQEMKPLHAYRNLDEKTVLCMFLPVSHLQQGDDIEQTAFNIVLSAVPIESSSKIVWTYLPSGQKDKGDPLGQPGYIGADWSRS
jgi:hypothetical protein